MKNDQFPVTLSLDHRNTLTDGPDIALEMPQVLLATPDRPAGLCATPGISLVDGENSSGEIIFESVHINPELKYQKEQFRLRFIKIGLHFLIAQNCQFLII